LVGHDRARLNLETGTLAQHHLDQVMTPTLDRRPRKHVSGVADHRATDGE
jgi:hypothetical protein